MVIAHEMAHMWFGDLVTMRWWEDLWLSESFAEYMGFQVLSEATGFTDTWTAFAMGTKTWGYDADQRPSTHPVAPNAADVTDSEMALENADGITYAKGASVLRQLVAWLGEEVFLAGVNEFLGRHRFGVASLADLLDALSSTSGLDVHRWAEQWLRTSGVDTIRVVRREEPAGESTGGVPHEGIDIEHPGLRPHRVAVGLYDRDGDVGDGHGKAGLVLRHRILVTLPVGDTSTPLSLGEGSQRPDLVLLNDGDLTYAKVRLDESSMICAADGLRHIADPLSRAVVWTAARDQVRDGELLPRDYLSLVTRHLPTEDDISIVEGTMAFARQHVIDRYLDPKDRTAALTAIGQTCRAILKRTDDEAASGLRLAALRGLIDAAVSDDDIQDLHAYLVDDVVSGRPPLDADLRWRALARLSVLGAVGYDEIDDELAGDNGGTGPENAARCRAALPGVAAKEAAWQAVFSGSQASGSMASEPLSTYLVAATAQGFWQPEQRTLLAPFVSRYFPAAVEVAARRGSSVAAAVGRAGFPMHDIDEATVRAGERCLAEPSPTAALRRVLADQLDDLRRALQVRSMAG